MIDERASIEKLISAPGFLKQGESYRVEQGQVFFLDKPGDSYTEGNTDEFINQIKVWLKRYPRLFGLIYYTMGASFVGKSAVSFLRDEGRGKIVLNVGSGNKRVSPEAINIDYYPFPEVDVVADIGDLPFSDSSADIVVNEFVVEHLPHPDKVVSELARVLKPGGKLYLAAPFLASFHSSPNDYYRWSKQGLKCFLQGFTEIESGIRCGPTSAMVYVVSEWLATVLSFGSSRLQQVIFMLLMVLFSPIKLIDFAISRWPSSENIAYGFYFIGCKKPDANNIDYATL